MQHHQEVTNSETLLLRDSDHKHAAAVVKNNIQHEEASKTLTHINTCRVIFTLTKVLVVGLFLALEVQQAVAIPQFSHTHGTHGYLIGLTVFHQQVTHTDTAARHAR